MTPRSSGAAAESGAAADTELLVTVTFDDPKVGDHRYRQKSLYKLKLEHTAERDRQVDLTHLRAGDVVRHAKHGTRFH
eukprot:2060057-Prymnesium_polylepis.1